MNKYKASNGIEFRQIGLEMLEWREEGRDWALVGSPDPVNGLAGFSLDSQIGRALSEMYQHERDEELDRWRWPENPDYVVYRDRDGAAVVVDESYPRKSSDRVYRKWLEDPVGSLGWGEMAARAYFDAHPEPKPWHDAADHEFWEITHTGQTEVFRVEFDYFVSVMSGRDGGLGVSMPVTHPSITAGRRIWPEVS